MPVCQVPPNAIDLAVNSVSEQVGGEGHARSPGQFVIEAFEQPITVVHLQSTARRGEHSHACREILPASGL